MKDTWVEYPGKGDFICMAFMCPYWTGPGRCSERFISLHGINTGFVLIDHSGKVQFVSPTTKVVCDNRKCNKNKDSCCSIGKSRHLCLNRNCKHWTDNTTCSFMDITIEDGMCVRVK